MNRLLIPIAILVLVGGGLGAWFLLGPRSVGITFRTEKATRGELLATVSATGTLEPEDVVDVGAQVAGSIKGFGTGTDGKPIDYGSPVGPDTVLAHIDDALYAAKVAQSKALLESARQRAEQAKAKVDQAKAKVDQAKANTLRAQADQKQAIARDAQSTREWNRVRPLGTTLAVTQSDYDVAQSNFETNRAGLAVADAAIAQARAAETDAVAAVADAVAAAADAEAAVNTAQAVLRQDQVNLGYCTIRSPVQGTILDRRVTLGQTVQAAFNTPSLFLIAKDLRRMKVWASVNEADVSQVRIGQPVRFGVDAYPNESFPGTVGRIRLNATNTQNVVVYTVEVLTDNDSGKLLPYMTANLNFEVDRRTDALLVPNAALRYKPSPQATAGGGGRGKEAEREKAGHGVVWVEENGKAKAVPVKLGLTDGNQTEVLGGELQPGTALIVGEVRAAGAPADAANPFAPPRFGAGKKQQ
jgi:HlyD family secretion protein